MGTMMVFLVKDNGVPKNNKIIFISTKIASDIGESKIKKSFILATTK
jgi:hypothetical protein